MGLGTTRSGREGRLIWAVGILLGALRRRCPARSIFNLPTIRPPADIPAQNPPSRISRRRPRAPRRAARRAARRCNRCRRPSNPAPSQAQRPSTPRAGAARARRALRFQPSADHQRPALAHLSGEAGPGRRLPAAQGGQGRIAGVLAAAGQLRGPCRLRSRERDADRPAPRRRLARRSSRFPPAACASPAASATPAFRRARSGSISSPAASSSPATAAPSCSRSRPAT